MSSSTSDVLLYFLAIFIPPLAVLLKRGCGADVIINIALTFLAWIPGIIHAWYVIAKQEKWERTRGMHEDSYRAGPPPPAPYGMPAKQGYNEKH